MKKRINIITIFLLLVISGSMLIAQSRKNSGKVYCDSLDESISGVYGCYIYSKFADPIKSIEQIENDFTNMIDTNKLTKIIYVKVFVDTSGNVICPEILRGCSKELDSVALNYVQQLKFSPARDRKNQKTPFQVSIPLYKNSLRRPN